MLQKVARGVAVLIVDITSTIVRGVPHARKPHVTICHKNIEIRSATKRQSDESYLTSSILLLSDDEERTWVIYFIGTEPNLNRCNDGVALSRICYYNVSFDPPVIIKRSRVRDGHHTVYKIKNK